MLAWTIYISFLGAAAMLLLPKGSNTAARILALVTAVAGFKIALAEFLRHRTGEMSTVTRVPWIPSLGIEYHLAADGISLTLILLTGIIAITGILFSWNIEERTKEFFALYLLLIGAVYGVFLSYDLFLLFVFYEIVIIPKYFLIAIWGSTRREYGAMKLALYSFVGSALVLIGLIAAYVVAGAKTTALADLDHGASDEGVERKLHRAILAAGGAPDGDQEILRDDDDLVEDEEEEEIVAEEYAVDRAYQQ